MTERKVRRKTAKERISLALQLSTVIAMAYLYFAESPVSADQQTKVVPTQSTATLEGQLATPDFATINVQRAPEKFEVLQRWRHSQQVSGSQVNAELASVVAAPLTAPSAIDAKPVSIVKAAEAAQLESNEQSSSSSKLSAFVEAMKSSRTSLERALRSFGSEIKQTFSSLRGYFKSPRTISLPVSTSIKESRISEYIPDSTAAADTLIRAAVAAEAQLNNYSSPTLPVNDQEELTAQASNILEPLVDSVEAEGLVGYEPAASSLSLDDLSQYPNPIDPVEAEGLVGYLPSQLISQESQVFLDQVTSSVEPENQSTSPAEELIVTNPTVAEVKKLNKSLPPIQKIEPRITPDGRMLAIQPVAPQTVASEPMAVNFAELDASTEAAISPLLPPVGTFEDQAVALVGGGGVVAPETMDDVQPAPQPALQPDNFSYDTIATKEEYTQQQEYLYSLLSKQEAQLREKYHGQSFATLEEMPEELRQFYLGTIDAVAEKYDVPPAILLSYLYAEQMGAGFGFEPRMSSALAAGEGQITPGHWNGWDGNSPYYLFKTNPDKKGSANDFDNNGVANVFSLPDNLAASAQDIARNGLINSNLKNLSPAEREAKYKNALARYNSGKSYENAPAVTKEYVKIGLSFLKSFDSGLFKSEFSPKATLFAASEPLTEQVTPEQLTPDSEDSLVKSYAAMYENSFGVPFTETEQQYVLSQEDIVAEYEKSGNLAAATFKLYERQVAYAMAHSDQYPYYKNVEYARVQQLALQHVGAQLSTAEEIQALLEWSASQNDGVIDVDLINNYLEKSSQAKVYEWLETMGPTVLGRPMTRAEMAAMLQQAYQLSAVKFVDSPGTQTAVTEKLPRIIALLKQQLVASPEFINAPDLIRIREKSPLGPLMVDENGNTLEFSVRKTYKDRVEGDESPWGDHAFIDHTLQSMEDLNDNWYGIDIIRAGKEPTAGTTVVSPIEGVAERVLIGYSDASDGAGNSVFIRGTGVYEGLWVRILHLGEKNLPAVGETLQKGAVIGEVGAMAGAHHLHVGVSMKYEGEFKGKQGVYYLPIPTGLTFSQDAGLTEMYWPSNREYQDGDLIVAGFYDRFGIKQLFAWSAPWNLPSGYREQYRASFNKFYGQYASELPVIAQSWLTGLDQREAVWGTVSQSTGSAGYGETQATEQELSEAQDEYLAAYSQQFVEMFGVPYTGADQQFALAQYDIFQTAEQSGEYAIAAQQLLERQVVAYQTNPHQWPFFFSKEAQAVQQVALKATGSFVESKAQIEAIIEWSTEQHGDFELEQIEKYFAGTDQAVIKKFFVAQFEWALGRTPTKAETGVYLAQAYENAGVSFIRVPGESDTISDALRAEILSDLQKTIASLAE